MRNARKSLKQSNDTLKSSFFVSTAEAILKLLSPYHIFSKEDTYTAPRYIKLCANITDGINVRIRETCLNSFRNQHLQ